MTGITATVMKYSNRSKNKPTDPLLQAALDKTHAAFRLHKKVNMVHLNDIFQKKLLSDYIWMRSPGLPWRNDGYVPWRKDRFQTIDEIRMDPQAVHKLRWFWCSVKKGEKMEAPHCLAFDKSDDCDGNNNEVIWEYSATMICGEAMFALPLTKAYQNKDGPIAYGYKIQSIGAQKIWNRFNSGHDYASLDFIDFDKKVPGWLICEAFKVLRPNIDFVHYEGGGVAEVSKIFRVWNCIVGSMINTTIETADGRTFKKNSGVLTCSYFADLIMSVCNYILCTWISLDQFEDYPKDLLVMRENSLLSLEGALDVKKANELMASIGMKLSDRSQVTKELKMVKFLGYAIGQDTKDNEELYCDSSDEY